MVSFSIKINPLPSQYFFNFTFTSFCSSQCLYLYGKQHLKSRSYFFQIRHFHELLLLLSYFFHCVNSISEVICTSMNYQSIRFSPCYWLDDVIKHVFGCRSGMCNNFYIILFRRNSSRRRYLTIILVLLSPLELILILSFLVFPLL